MGTGADGVYSEKPAGSACLGGRQEPCCKQHPVFTGARLRNRTPRDVRPEMCVGNSPSSHWGCETLMGIPTWR